MSEGEVMKEELLGEPMNVRAVAQLIGCSPWTVRNRFVRAGLPHMRTAGASGRLLFFREQVIRWISQKQKERR
jgi:phage terminase Nu1 subunit (DNA packaging protein)